MAKSKDKLPKTILGVTVPKELRRSGALESLLSSPEVRQILADALVAAAAAAAASLTRPRPADGRNEQAKADGPDGAARALPKLGEGGAALGTALSEVARSILPGETHKVDKAKADKGRKKKDADRVHH